MLTQIPLKYLDFGHNAPGAINARVAGRQDGIETLAANIHARGQIEPLIVQDGGAGTYYVSDGNRRLAAFRMIHGDTSDHLIECKIREVGADGAFEDSLTAAVLAHQLHPVDQYEAFARLQERGKTNEEIAHHFGLTQKQVRQALALGRLSPKIRQAWRDGEIKAEVAQTFTLLTEHKLQDKLFDKLAKSDDLEVWQIRRALSGDGKDDVGASVNFVTIAAYEARGGRVMEDLFRERHLVSDSALLGAMVREKLEAECARLVADGWQWATIDTEMPRSWRDWEKVRVEARKHMTPEELQHLQALEKAARAAEDDDNLDADDQDRIIFAPDEFEATIAPRCYSEKQKAKLGCVVAIDENGLSITYGVKRPEAASSSSAAAATPTAGEAAPVKEKPAIAKSAAGDEISQALTERLSVQLTTAGQTALIQDADLAISVLLAGIATKGYRDGIFVDVNGHGAQDLDLLGGRSFSSNLELARALTPAQRLDLLVTAAGAALNFKTTNNNNPLLRGNASTVCEAIAAPAMNAALRGAFDAGDYFGGVSKAITLLAIKEALGIEIARQWEDKPKADIVKFATENVPQTGWLPPQLRVKGYDGPPNGKPAKTEKPVKAKASAKKPTTKAAPAKKAKTKKKTVKR